MKYKIFLALLIVALGTTQCKKEAIYGNTGTIRWQDCLEFFDHDVTICLEDIEEARCPCNADCIWEGMVTATLKVTAPGGEYTIQLSTNSSPDALNHSDTIENRVIRFVKTNITDCNDYGQKEKYKVEVEVTNI